MGDYQDRRESQSFPIRLPVVALFFSLGPRALEKRAFNSRFLRIARLRKVSVCDIIVSSKAVIF